jgi:ABC-type dipeptide/oligopeptide/nickel transport system permease component
VTAGALLRRLAQGALLLAVVSLVTFALLHAVPGGPLAAYLVEVLLNALAEGFPLA